MFWPQKDAFWINFFRNVIEGWVTYMHETWAVSEPTQENGRQPKKRMSNCDFVVSHSRPHSKYSQVNMILYIYSK